LISCHTNRVLCTRLQVQRSKHWRDLESLAFHRKFNPPVSRLLVDVWATPSATTLTVEALLQHPNFPHMPVYKLGQPIPTLRDIFPSLYISDMRTTSRVTISYGYHLP
jgi:hypothetical protein